MSNSGIQCTGISDAPEDGVYYSSHDYAGLGRRFLIIIIDLGVLIVSGVFINVILEGNDQEPPPAFWYAWFGFAYVYLTVLEASPIGTLGFLITRVKVVTLKGKRPSILRMTFRLLIWALGPFNPIVDLLWLSGDTCKQTLRDKIVSTLVVHRSAEPAGKGRIVQKRYMFMGMSLVFHEVDQRVVGADEARPGPPRISLSD